MKTFLTLFLFIASLSLSAQSQKYGLVLHGGAGFINRDNFSDEQVKTYELHLNTALSKGYDMLEEGADAVDVVVEVLKILEDDSLFNAGRGAVFSHDTINELDASIMDGNGRAGAVTGVTTVKNPITAARAVMDHSEHVMLAGKGAEDFAATNNLEIVDPSYFFTQKPYDYLMHVLNQSSGALNYPEYDKFGTVGVAVLDKNGNLAAGTSTGGMTNKRWNRIGDSPIIGAGTFANNQTCAVSCTGHGEFFIRGAVAHDMHARMAYGESSLQEAAYQIIQEELKNIGGDGGLIAIDKEGNISMETNTTSMFRAWHVSGDSPGVAIFVNP